MAKSEIPSNRKFQNLPYTPSGSKPARQRRFWNTDNTVNELETIYEYELDLRPGGSYKLDETTS